MSCKVSDIVLFLEKMFPLTNALDFDNPGLIIGSKNASVSKVMLTLDCNYDAVIKAKEAGAELIISHHPLIFGGIDSINYDEGNGKIIHELIKNDISLYACHTQLDMTSNYGNIEIAKALGAKSFETVEGAELGVVFRLDEEISCKEFAGLIIKGLNSSGVNSINSPESKVKCVFVQGGAFDEDQLPYIIASDADTAVSGEIKHHVAVLLQEYGINSFVAGHNATERVYLPKLCGDLKNEFQNIDFFVDYGNEIGWN